MTNENQPIDEVEAQYDIVEPTTPDDVPETCEVPGCESSVDNFHEAYPVPSGVNHRGDGRAVMCDHHHVAALILACTRPDPPYVDVGLYQEVTYYSRALAAETFGIPATEKVTPPQQTEDEED